MYVCMYVCMSVCLSACMHACMYVCMYVYTHEWWIPDWLSVVNEYQEALRKYDILAWLIIWIALVYEPIS